LAGWYLLPGAGACCFIRTLTLPSIIFAVLGAIILLFVWGLVLGRTNIEILGYYIYYYSQMLLWGVLYILSSFFSGGADLCAVKKIKKFKNRNQFVSFLRY